MKIARIISAIIMLLLFGRNTYAQINANAVFSLVNLTTIEMNSIILPHKGSMIFNSDDNHVYQYTGASWTIVDTTASGLGATQGSVIFSNAAGNATENNSQLFWNNTTNRLGIGTNTPTETLDVNGSIIAKKIQIEGSLSTAITNTIANLTLTDIHYTVIITGNHDITLPTASSVTGRIYVLKNINNTDVSCSQYIADNGTSSTNLRRGRIFILQSDGSNWQQINKD